MAELYHECGIAAIYHLAGQEISPLAPHGEANRVAGLIPRLLLDIQNRGQLAAGMTSYDAERKQLIKTHKDVGGVNEVFRLGRKDRAEQLMRDYNGEAAIGHVRYATCGADDRSYAQPFERSHVQKSKWFSFCFNGQLANYQKLREQIEEQDDFHLARETDTEIIMHMLSQDFSIHGRGDLVGTMRRLSLKFDGAYNMAFMNARGDMFVARDPLGIRPLCYAIEGPLFAAASESVALWNLGFDEKNIETLQPGEMILIQHGRFEKHRFAESPKKSHCFFEWIYFANAASTLDDRSVYLSRTELGKHLADQETLVPDEDTIVVPVPDTAKSAASSMAYELNVPCLEGLMRNRYVGRTFIESKDRADKVRTKFTPLPEVFKGRKVLLVEDSIVRSTTMKGLIDQIRDRGGAKEIHVRVACPPIIAPCFYGIDMSKIGELFAPKFMEGQELTPEIEEEMARVLGADSLRYLPVDTLHESIGIEETSLCRACVTGHYPTEGGRELYQLAVDYSKNPELAQSDRTYDIPTMMSTRS
ncbi:MAG: amidophosphoribosyltransferase [Rubinisphaera brasiliensis]|uniref:Amidophosphoribosyltransferase n=1 Tax=Rubinisphaera brasiliensis (strain ATCC 49424 / DSM 5305 / JCM 21570 / IAM 15109 / NBRC 103401 / IFAM 1448) TaxID=756272 RepID=F0SM88_RUBBR|nr:amidophosphoribosyltransferase [Rubinisphaera brasiliensis]ADY62067.1 amidophosphoribosyltransferase [Rubinisphaera brasiliensis DSM 5305]